MKYFIRVLFLLISGTLSQQFGPMWGYSRPPNFAGNGWQWNSFNPRMFGNPGFYMPGGYGNTFVPNYSNPMYFGFSFGAPNYNSPPINQYKGFQTSWNYHQDDNSGKTSGEVWTNDFEYVPPETEGETGYQHNHVSYEPLGEDQSTGKKEWDIISPSEQTKGLRGSE